VTVTAKPVAEAAPLVTAVPALRHQRVAFVAMVLFFVVAPYVVYPVFLMKALCFALFACAFNLLIGYVGLLSFGHAVFFGSAGYATAHSAKLWGFSPELAILFGVVVASILGVIIGALAIRSRGVYFMVLAIFLLGFLVVYRAIHSPFGQVLKGIRENEPRAVSLGYQAEHYKLIAFALSATLAGLAGGTKSIVFQLASLTDVHWTMSGEVVLMTLLGGLGTVFGPVVGALVLITLEHYLAQLGSWFTIAQGVIFVVCVLTFRRGIVGELGHLLKKPL
jgi:branched-chain amino acid transport system permease protein